MHTILNWTRKGGGGKSTLTTNLGVAGVLDNKKTVIFDTDPQQSCCFWGDRRTISELPVVVSAQEARIKYELDKARKIGIDLAFIDAKGGVDSTAATASENADFILIPTKIDGFDMDALVKTVEIVKFSKRPAAFVITQMPVNADAATEKAKEQLATFGIEICPYGTYYRADYRHSVLRGLGVVEYNPKGKAAEEVRAIYKWLLEKVS